MDRRSRPGPEPTTLEAVGNQWRYALVVVQAGEEEEVIIRSTTVTQSGSVNKYVLSCWQNAECELMFRMCVPRVLSEVDFAQASRTVVWELIPFCRFQPARIKPNQASI